MRRRLSPRRFLQRLACGPSLLAALSLLLFVVPVPAEEHEPWAGEWRSFWRESAALLTLRQDDDAIAGGYEPGGGRIVGVANGRLLEGEWTEGEASGRFVFALGERGQTFTGRFDSGEWWNGQRIRAEDEEGLRFSDASSPRETLRSVVVAFNDASGGGSVEQLHLVEPMLDYEGGGNGRERNRRRTLLWRLLDMSTFRIYDAPPRPEADEVVFPIGPVDATETYDLPFRRLPSGAWAIVVEPEATLAAAVDRFLDALGYDDLAAYALARRDSPRGAMRDFLFGVHDWDRGGAGPALSRLDLSFLPADLRADEGPILADYLLRILDRAGFVVWQEVPDDPDAPAPYLHYMHPLGAVAIERVATAEDAPGRWMFSIETLRNAPVLYSAMQDLPRAEGLAPAQALSRFFGFRERLRAVSPDLVRRDLGLENWQWAALALTLAASLAMALLAGWAVRAGLAAAPLPREESDEERAARGHSFVWPVRVAVAGLLTAITFSWLGLVGDSSVIAYRVLAVLSVLGVAVLVYRVVAEVGAILARRAEDTASYSDNIVVALATGIVKLTVVVTALILAADAVDLPYEGVLAGLGVGGLAVAFAARATIANMIGGALLLADRPFRRGDLLQTEGSLAVVDSVGLRSTRLRRIDDCVLVIPNSQLSDQTIVNWGARRRRRLEMPISVAYDTPRETLDIFVQRLVDVVKRQETADPADAYAWIAAFGDSAFEIGILGYFFVFTYEDETKARHALAGNVIDLAREMDVKFAFPTRTVHLSEDPARVGVKAPDHPRAS